MNRKLESTLQVDAIKMWSSWQIENIDRTNQWLEVRTGLEIKFKIFFLKQKTKRLYQFIYFIKFIYFSMSKKKFSKLSYVYTPASHSNIAHDCLCQ